MAKEFMLSALLLLGGYPDAPPAVETSSNAPEYARDATVLFKAADSYEHALHIWTTPEDVNAWIAATFSYDMARATGLSETQRAQNGLIAIYHPADFFNIKAGVCVDLSRFGVETLRHIDPQSEPRYLMIEFDPMHMNGHALRLHWLVSFGRGGKRYFFADSKRPGLIAGPYADTRAFIDEYAQYRGRRIVAFRELESYQKQRRAQALKRSTPRQTP